MPESASQKRALFFVFDGGTGVGHLRRLASIAKRLQGRFSCLIVTGHRAAAHWFVPEECEYVHLPSWDSLFAERARYWGRAPFLTVDKKEAVRLRKQIIHGVVRGFRPDAIFVDHLPLGAEEELATVLERSPARKYLVTRGVLNETENLRGLILGGRAHDSLRDRYDRILVASDRRVFDFARQYNLAPEIRAKTVHTGYVAESVASEAIARARGERGLDTDDVWVVASAGGGQMGERLIEGCLHLARAHPRIAFDVVVGPRSNLGWTDPHRSVIAADRLRVHREVPRMSLLHAAADVVISSGGYNSLLEALQGRAKILCFPNRKDQRDEQYHHAARLKPFVDLDVYTDLAELPAVFGEALRSLGTRRPDRRAELDFGGAARIETIVREDLGIGA
jgi:predicted glycosyltransferase